MGIGFSSIILAQIVLFYVLPLTAGPTDTMGLVILQLLGTLLLSFFAGLIKRRIKYSYPVIVSVLFLPAIFIFYNSSALIYILWHFVASVAGLVPGVLLGCLLRSFFDYSDR